ncbi:hypothetical protein EF910_17460 [Streptomyces sp. WAC07149]|uniref:hypothetical protein n=1 Tax=Streptomyces sp. WAC07149 TaxID=2487425 RepID=UPI000F7668B5|nr:hypothetical protein [Streptomyces sp. WAC07149]RST04333.1 hypothetical protein EF910_17460 [Streptomyces sp. WAC07149]
MEHEAVWTYGVYGTDGTAGQASTGPEDMLRMVRGATPAEPGGHVEARVAECALCGAGADEFEAAKGECFCVGCCIPVGITDGDVHPPAYPWTLEPSEAPLPPASPGPDFEPSDLPRCPAGHEVFQTAIALAFARDGAVRGISVALRCPEDGALCLYVDNARVAPGDT